MQQLNLFLKSEAQATPIKKYASVDYSSESNEYYTPSEVAIATRKVSPVDLDPASCEIANSVIQAKCFFTQTEDGLNQPWYCNFFLCNPPGGKIRNESQAALWWDKAVKEWKSGRADAGVFVAFNPELISRRQNVWDFQVCIPRKRLAFLKIGLTGTLEIDPSPPKFNAIIHLPSRHTNPTKPLFKKHFESIGRVIQDRV